MPSFKPAQSQAAWESNTGVAVKAETDIKKGFVYKRVPHVTLKAIANNPEIDTIHEKWQQQLEPIRTQLNQLLKQSWEDWQIPREPDAKWSQQVNRPISSMVAPTPETATGNRCLHCPQCRYRNSLRSTLRRHQTLTGDWPLHRRKPLAPSGTFT